MRRFISGLIALVLVPHLGGCGTSPFAQEWPEEITRTDTGFARRAPGDATGTANASPLALPQVDEAIALRDALALALIYHPDLAAYQWNIRAAEARTLQAGLLPNPELGVEVEDFAGSGDFSGSDALETTVSLSQLVELGGDRLARVDVARYERDLAGWDYEARRIEVLTETAQRYLAVLAAQRRLELAQDIFKVIDRTATTIDRRVEAGEESSLQATRFRVQRTTARLAVDRAQRQLAGARQQLAAMWGQVQPAFGSLTGDLPAVEPLPPLPQLVELLDQNPRLAQFASVIALRQAQTKLAKARGVPDVTVGAGVRHFNESDEVAFLVGASVPLPLFDRNQGEVLATRFEAARARAEQEAMRLNLHTQLAQQHLELAWAVDQATALRTEVLPAAREAFTGVQKAFEQGEISLLDLLDAQRTLVESESEYADALATYHQNLAALEGLLGQSLAEVNPTNEQPATQQEQQ